MAFARTSAISAAIFEWFASSIDRWWSPAFTYLSERYRSDTGQLLLLAIASDAGTLLRAWAGPLFLLHRFYDLLTISGLGLVFLPTCRLSAVATVARFYFGAEKANPTAASRHKKAKA